MKLRNKKTGEIVEATDFDILSDYKSLAEFNEEWEDYEDDEYYYAITSIKADGGITKMKNIHNDMTTFDKSIGNYFKTKEEAEKAVEKLKAWKRLKDKKFEFTEWYKPDGCEPFIIVETNIGYDVNKELQKDLDLLFGGEE